jgi:hypothetical protein
MAAPGLAWMVIGADTAPELATAKTSGATHGLVEVYWDQVQSSAGGAVAAAGVLTSIQRVLDAGQKVCLRANLQYIPTFVDSAAVKFRRNGAVDYNPGNVSGNNARDWVWSASTRALADDYLTKLFAQLDWSKIDRVQLGGGPAGELQYPDSDGTQWWGYSAPAQTGTDLAAGQTVCPSPGYVPSTGTTWTSTDIAWAAWYSQSIINWMLWLIAKHRAYYSGPIWVMHPGAGLRKTSQTPTGGQALNYRVNVAKGVDWDGQMAAYPDANVHPYCTWSDAEHFWAPDPFSDVNDGNAAPWYHLLRVARARGRAAQIWGENTGGQSNVDMDRVFTSGAVAYGYQGLTWLSADSLADGTSDTYANLATRIATANKAYAAYSRGINLAGGEFAAAAATLPGTYGTDYAYDGATAITNVAGRGHKLVRVPFRWERVQPTRGAALNSAELTRLQGVVSSVQSAGMRAVLDCHNYARYIRSTADGGAELVLGDTLPVADLVDLWTRLSTAFRGNDGVYAYGLSNEPHDLTGTTGSFSGTVRYDWASGVQGWTGDSATASNVSGQLRLTSSLGSGNVNMRKDDAATVSGGSTPTGPVIQVKVTPVALPAGTWTVKAQWQNSGFAWQNPTSVALTRVDTGATVSSLTVGQAVYATCVFTSITSPPNAFCLQVDGTGATAGTVTVDFDDFSQGALTGGATAAQVWENASQQVVTAIRNNSDTTKIAVAGYNWSGAKTWQATHAAPWISDPANNVVYEAHYYFDDDNSGDYPNSYSSENSAATGAGYASLASRAVTELQNWTSWLVANGVRGLLGEVGWPNTADTDSWNAVGEAIYDECDLHAVDATYWAGGARWGTTYNLSIYTGTDQTTVKTQAAVVESHLSSTTVTSGGSDTTTPAVVRRNLAPNPALKVNATDWSAVDNAGATLSSWVRSTSVGATLPRATGFEGTQAGDVKAPRAAVTAGLQYYWAVSVRATGAALSANMLVNYYTALSGGSFVANSGATVPLDLASGATGRFVLGPYTVPATAVAGYLKLNDLDAGCEVTAYQVELSSTYDGTYFDGDSLGASWDGTSGNSTSTIRRFVEAITIGDSFTKTQTAVGPVATDAVAVAESFAIAAASPSGGAQDTVQVRDGFLVFSLEWDPRRGRNRVSAFTFADNVVQARVSRRPVSGGTWQLVRGGSVAVAGGRMAHPVDDYEFPSGIDLLYRIEGLTGASSGTTVVQSGTVSRRSVADSVWLKFITAPALNRQLEFMGRSDITRPSRTAVYNVQNRPDPVVVSDVHASRQFTIKVKTETAADTDALDHALSQGLPCYLQVPQPINCPSVYAVVGDYSFEPPTLKSHRNVWTIPLTEVSPPPPSIVSPQATWQELINLYPTWQDVMAAVPLWMNTAD